MTATTAALALYHYRYGNTGLVVTRTEYVPPRLTSITDRSGLCHGFTGHGSEDRVMIPFRGKLEISAVDTPTP